jgi:predicted PurR-regulated permease PerM
VSAETASSRERWTRVGLVAWAFVGILVLSAATLWLLGRLTAVLTPLVLALVIVFFLKGPVNWLVDRGLKRTLAVVVAYLGGIVTAALFFTFVVPFIAERVNLFVEAFPTYYDQAYDVWLDVQAQYRALTIPGWLQQAIDSAQDEIVTWASNLSRRTAAGLFAAGGQAVGFLFNSVMSLVIAFYLLKDLPRLREGALRLLPESRRTEARHLYCTVVGAVGGFIRGQLIVAAAVGILTTIALALLGVPFPVVIGMATGIFNVIPYFGAIIGAALAAISAAFVDPWLALWAVLALVAIQQVEGLFISPRVMSDQVDLHPVAVILSLLAGGTLLGFVGLLIAIPVASAVKGVAVYYLEKHGGYVARPRRGTRFRGSRGGTRDDDENEAQGPHAAEGSGDPGDEASEREERS